MRFPAAAGTAAASLALAAVVVGAGATSGPSEATSTSTTAADAAPREAPAAPGAAPTARAAVVRMPSWETATGRAIQQVRAKRRVPAVKSDACATAVARGLAQRLATSARASRVSDWSTTDLTRLRRCARPGLRLSVDAAWESNARTPALWVSKNYTANTIHPDRRWQRIGTGAYRDSRGRVHVAVIQLAYTRG